jgi:alpha-tubulin suppressor-like RCC1 family protein
MEEMLYVRGALLSRTGLTLICMSGAAALITGCKLELTRELVSTTVFLGTSPTPFTILGIKGGSDLVEDAKLYDGLIPTITWIDSADETSYDVSILDSTGSTVVCGPISLAADTITYTFSTGCSLSNGVTYKALVKAVWTDGTVTNYTFSPSYSFHTGPFISTAAMNTQEYGVATMNVSLSQAAAVSVSVDYVTADQTAFSGTDYVHRPTSTLTFAPGETSKAITIPIFSNRDNEGDRDFRVEFSSANSGSIETTSASITIQDNDTAPYTGIMGIAGGASHVCALFSSGGVKCWGYNNNGQLGDNSTTHRNSPVDVSGLTSGVSAITAGDYHTCALLSSGGIRCWGSNGSGQLGDNSTTNRLTPVNVSGLASGVTAISAGSEHTCALLSTGGIRCWGANSFGQIGDNSTTQRNTSVNVTGLTSGVASVSAGGFHTCAVLVAGGAKCWGYNSFGELGDSSSTDRNTAVDVSGLTSGVSNISSGSHHTCAVLTTGAVRCWGHNTYGSLGDGSTTHRNAPVNVSGLTSGVTSIMTGDFHSCVVMNTGGAKCWGYNSSGEAGNGTISRQTSPVDVTGLSSGVAELEAGSSVTFARLTSGSMMGWGANSFGQVGDNSTTVRNTVVDIYGLASGVSAIATYESHTCVLLSTGGVKCWGYNGEGPLGDGTRLSRLTPVDVSGLTSGVSAIATGGEHSCAILTTGAVKCWGYNSSGQIGDNTTTRRTSPIDVSGLTSGATAIEAGYFHTCAIVSGGVKCWGNNGSGQLGDNSTTNRTAPVDVSGLTSGVSAISLGLEHSCALIASTGGVKCWGNNTEAQLGDNSVTQRNTPVDVSGLTSGVSAISAGGYHTCALLTSGGVKCWGKNTFGELGDNSTTQRTTPVNVSGLTSGVSAVSTGHYHSCAILTAGDVKCWGANSAGEMGDNTLIDRLTPVSVLGLSSGVSAVVAGPYHTIVILNTGTAKGWGSDYNFQLGDTYRYAVPQFARAP